MEPLASKYRPRSLDTFIGQTHLIGKAGTIRKLIEQGKIPSMIFWGPPGTGKTSLAYIISLQLFYDFHKIQATISGKDSLRNVLRVALKNQEFNKKTILFIDEIHRWNKAQQDALLPYVEKGIITLIGATTENPSFSINSALLSRCKVFVFNSHSEDDIEGAIKAAVEKDFSQYKFEKSLFVKIAHLANGDLRNAFNIIEMCINLSTKNKITNTTLKNVLNNPLYYDKNGEEHYNIISAIHKSMRSSNPDAAAYWIERMLQAGEDPMYIARRLLRFAAEDVGSSDTNAFVLANSVMEACKSVGHPECDIFLIMLAIYLSKAPKDNSAYIVEQKAREDAVKFGNLPVPMHIRNAPTKLMKDLGYGKGYEYDHDLKNKKSSQQCFPDKLKNRKYLPAK